ncbi:MAG: hypothetical protein WCR58_09405 [Bacteroidales bacterium]|jgi:hypothetical protein|nr:hypothetical protein [Bacteroidales bacterium]MDD3700868.1 hypothetical protein [Bacteroidales bacterium]MDY0369835.1 hypothetical protein [Bacteroidales bacterium]
MEMDLGMTIVVLVIILLCIMPFVIMHYNKVNKKKKMLQSLTKIAQQHNCTISQHEFCSDFVLGIDESRNFVFFFKQTKEESISEFVDLSETRMCQAVKQARNVNSGSSSYSIIKRVELLFLPISKNKEEARFVLYDEEIDRQLSEELELVDNWVKRINTRIKAKK